MKKKTLIASALLGATAFSLAVALPANADTPHDSTTTVTVIAAELTSTAPLSTAMTEAIPGEIAIGEVDLSVVDNRGGTVGWTSSVAATDFASGSSAIIPAANLAFSSSTTNAMEVTGTADHSDTPAVGSSTAAPILTATGVSGRNSAAWVEQLALTVPADALAGNYVSTVTYSTI